MQFIYEKRKLPIHRMSSRFLSPQPHIHKEIEIVYVIRGQAVAVADRKRYILHSGDLFIAFPYQVHYYENSQEGEYKILVFTTDLISGLEQELQSSVPETNVFSPTESEMTMTALNYLYSEDMNTSLTCKTGWLNLLMDATVSKLTLVPNTLSYNATLRNILKYCSKNFKDDLTLDILADELHISKYHISHLLNKRLSMNFNEYINALRINEACYLLEKSDFKITDIAEDVGFGSIRSFNRAFGDIMKMTPTEYKALLKK